MILDPATPKVNEYSNEESAEFWKCMDEILQLDNEKYNADRPAVINSNLVKYLKFATDSYKEYINTDRDLYRMALTLVESLVFSDNIKFCLSKLLSLLNIDLLDMSMKFFISYILLFEAKRNLYSLDMMIEYQGFAVFYNTLYTQFAYLEKYSLENSYPRHKDNKEGELTDLDFKIIDEMKQISTVLMDLLYQIFKYCKSTISDIQIVDDFFVHFLMHSVRSDTTSDLFSTSEFKVLLALNEQYIMFAKDYKIENKVFKYVLNESVSKSFVELLLLKFNRSSDSSLQIMMCKIIYLVLTTTKDNIAMNFFYMNDLNVFVDVLLRELQNISENQESLRNTFLRVLLPLIKNTELSKTHYRKDDLTELLQYLSNYDSFCTSDDISDEQKITVKLVFKILNEVEWLQPLPQSDSDPSVTSRSSSISINGMTFINNNEREKGLYNVSTNDSIISIESLGKRKSRPPPPLPPTRKSVAPNRANVNDYLMGIRSVE
ncbi:similar to Saccharomyces cerevisiae YDL146W LDB17 Protein involved in the regulation of endocytosis [Maudiozyma barnettii]|uniref:Similar to Saccharomyces cerevisiae YDL146W LDB17 Protein involved in the regulation of endocytosis n=1 Tax=Maudiozyma barnettii TaxID=61262 RepID=A0A8H2ZFC4_9SACH|nr:Ldb17p [Kazachstania barnettii]CAB4252205.1 similar to Saccharomyces cerevisiae YDL146W LDB17 Protein involved in the regulation of endocytosis [Kazachstania barnettii]CAD1778829.1 similar to Saccharomyces cerevisiae YDL146W LDB17 Protein involved in the regulation of endocytosis [Kazachstania barnettii]